MEAHGGSVVRIVVLRETASGERRVALVPESCKKLIQAGYEIAIESGAGEAAGFADSSYTDAGAAIVADPASLLASGDIVLKVTAPSVSSGNNGGRDETAWMKPGAIYVGSLMPLRNLHAVRALAAKHVTAFATDAIPRTTRAQSMDTLSSMANLGGYKGALLAAVELNRYFPMLTTAAGMVFPAKVFVIGAGVAGLQAIATARRLGANVVATDVRPEVKEQIESVGAKYVGIELKESAAAGGGYAKELSEDDRRRQAELLAAECAQSDVVITTALIGGVFAPRLISADTVRKMKSGSVIVDLGADGGGNCELSKPGETVQVGGVTIMAPLNLPSTVPYHASLLFSRNLTAFLSAFTKDKAFHLDFDDDIQQGAVITHGGDVKNARTREALEQDNK
jgi:H+-translocating NAD(P) transhydrogenase subunit alpha